MNDYHLVKVAAKTKQPLILSTGLSTMDEIANAVYFANIIGYTDLLLY